MNKSDLIQNVASTNGLSQAKATEIVNSILSAVQAELIAGNRVNISDFGVFEISERKAFTGHNPVSGEKIEVGARRIPTFRAGKGLKEALNA